MESAAHQLEEFDANEYDQSFENLKRELKFIESEYLSLLSSPYPKMDRAARESLNTQIESHLFTLGEAIENFTKAPDEAYAPEKLSELKREIVRFLRKLQSFEHEQEKPPEAVNDHK